MNPTRLCRLQRGLILFFGATLLCAAHAEDIDDKARKAGMKKAPELVQSLQLACTVTDARKITQRSRSGSLSSGLSSDGGGMGGGMGGGGGGGGPPGGGGGGGPPGGGGGGPGGGGGGAGGGGMGGGPMGASTPEQYEVACAEGLGYIVVAARGNQPASAYLCIEAVDAPNAGADPGRGASGRPGGQGGPANGPGGAPGAGGGPGPGTPGGNGNASPTGCALPGNSAENQRTALASYAAKANVPCQISAGRGVGHTTRNTLIEIACNDSSGYLLFASQPLRPDQPVEAEQCFTLPDSGPTACKLTNRAAQFAPAEALLHQAEGSCQVRDRRYMASTTSGDDFFEFACQDGKGYVLRRSAQGTLVGTIACEEPAVAAQLGGCKLSTLNAGT